MGFEVGALHLLCGGLGLVHAGLCGGWGDVVAHAGGGGARARRVGEEVDVGEGLGADEGEGLGPLVVGFAGEADDQVCADRQVRDVGAGVGGEGRKTFGIATASHALEGRVAAALEREVEVGAEPTTRRRPTGPEVWRDIPRLKRAKADAGDGGVGEQRVNEVGERTVEVGAVAA